MSERFSRGKVISLIAGIPTVVALTAEAAVAADTAGATAMKKTLGYIDVSKTKGASCATCKWYTPAKAGAKSGKCQLIQGGTVMATGWCKSYTKKA